MWALGVVVLPFGLTNSLTTFMFLMNNILSEYLNKFVLVFIDDIMAYSRNEEEHKEHLKLVLQTLRENKLYAKFSKCEFYKTIIQYLGHAISKEGLVVDPEKVKSMVNWPIPKDVVVVRSFMELVGYYRRFIEGFFKIAYPITSLQKNGENFEWTVECQKSFDKLKHLLTTTPILKLAYIKNEFTIYIDACMEGLKGVLLQYNYVILYESRKLKNHQRNYDVYDLEIVVVLHGLKMWRHYLLGNKFNLITNHINLKYIFNQPNLNARQDIWMAFLCEFEFNIKHLKEKENKIVDALRRHVYNLMEVVISSIKIDFLEKIKNYMHKYPKYLDMQQKL